MYRITTRVWAVFCFKHLLKYDFFYKAIIIATYQTSIQWALAKSEMGSEVCPKTVFFTFLLLPM